MRRPACPGARGLKEQEWRLGYCCCRRRRPGVATCHGRTVACPKTGSADIKSGQRATVCDAYRYPCRGLFMLPVSHAIAASTQQPDAWVPHLSTAAWLCTSPCASGCTCMRRGTAVAPCRGWQQRVGPSQLTWDKRLLHAHRNAASCTIDQCLIKVMSCFTVHHCTRPLLSGLTKHTSTA